MSTLKTLSIRQDSPDFVLKTTGTALTLTSLNDDASTANFIIPGATYKDNIQFEYSVREAKPQASSPDGHSQRRVNLVIKWPRLLTNGQYVTDTYRGTWSRSVDTSSVQTKEMVSLSCQAAGVVGAEDLFKLLSLN